LFNIASVPSWQNNWFFLFDHPFTRKSVFEFIVLKP
jgi:hypothetical protein